MKPSSKLMIAVVAIMVVIPLIVLLSAEVILNSAAVKSEIERSVTQALEMDFKIEGRINIRFLPLLALTANDVTVRFATGQIAAADRIDFNPRLLPLINRKVEIKKTHIQQPRLTLNPRSIDKIIALIEAESEGPLPVESLTIESFAISGAGATYTDEQTQVDVSEMNVQGKDLDIIAGSEVIFNDFSGFLKALNFTGELTARRIVSSKFKLENLRASVDAANGRITADPATAEILGSDTKLQATFNLMQPHSTFDSTLVVSGLDMKKMAETWFPAVNIRSKVDLTTGITAAGIDLEKSIDYVFASGPNAGSKQIPIQSVIVKPFTLAARDLAFTHEVITIDQAGLKIKGDQWALIANNRGTLVDFDSFLKATKMSGPATIKRLTLPDQLFENLQGTIRNNHGLITSDPVELEFFGERTRLGINWDLRQTVERVQLRVDIPGMDTGRFFRKADNMDILNGTLKLQAELEARGDDRNAIVKNINGRFSMQGANLTMKGVDFDKALDEFQKMGAYGFRDFATLITLGPLASIVSHGYDQLEALEKMMAAKGDSTIRQIVSDWKITNGVAQAGDVAFSTQRHRVAIAGSIDFLNRRLQNVTIAVVDPNGCIVNREIVDGPFENPEVKDTGVIQRTFIRPLKRFLKSDCQAFYNGSVAHPTTSQK